VPPGFGCRPDRGQRQGLQRWFRGLCLGKQTHAKTITCNPGGNNCPAYPFPCHKGRQPPSFKEKTMNRIISGLLATTLSASFVAADLVPGQCAAELCADGARALIGRADCAVPGVAETSQLQPQPHLFPQ